MIRHIDICRAGSVHSCSNSNPHTRSSTPIYSSVKEVLGFTLIELVVVMALMGTVFLFALPRIENVSVLNQEKKSIRRLVYTIENLKNAAVRDQKIYTMNIDLSTQSVWVTSSDMTEEDLQQSAEKATAMAGIRVADIVFSEEKVLSMGRAEIVFHPEGYCDRALIHFQNDENQYWTISIEPFLPNVRAVHEYIEL